MIAKLTPKITYPFMVHWGFLYIKEDSGPTIDLLCAVNTNPAVPTSIPIIINILPRFFLSIPFFYHRMLFLGFGAKCCIANKCQNWLIGLSFAIPTPFIIS